MIDKKYMRDNGFSLEQYPDGKFWLLRHPTKDIFVQLNESFQDATLWQDGWVDSNLNEEEINQAVSFINNASKEVN